MKHSSAQAGVYVSPSWNYSQFNEGCYYNNLMRTNCEDIRVCKSAAASLAMGGWPVLCGWVDEVIPKVCCGYPLILGGALMKKIDKEQERHAYCGRAVWDPKLSLTKDEFNSIYHNLIKGLPEVNRSNPSLFDPPPGVPPKRVYHGHCADGCFAGGLGSHRDIPMQFEFPWMVSIHIDGKHKCGGSLIDRNHVLSAAHCFVSRSIFTDPKNVVVRAGDTDNDKGYQIKVTKIIIHERYIEDQHYNDIAILTIENDDLPNLYPICLPSQELSIRSFVGASATLLGWGKTSYGGKGTIELQAIRDIPVVSSGECRESYSKISSSRLPGGITNDFICAGVKEGGADACTGDSGGPLMYKHTDYDFPVGVPTERWVLVGIVSFGFRCGERGFPGVYTRLSSYMSWILRNIKF